MENIVDNASGKIYSGGSVYRESLNVIVEICDANTMKVINDVRDFYNANWRIDRDKLNMRKRKTVGFSYFNTLIDNYVANSET